MLRWCANESTQTRVFLEGLALHATPPPAPAPQIRRHGRHRPIAAADATEHGTVQYNGGSAASASLMGVPAS